MSDHECSQTGGIARRDFLRGMGATVVAGAVLGAHVGWPASAFAAHAADPAAARPNILILMSDQERPPMYWPDGWAETHLPARNRLLAHGVQFRHMFCSTAMCSPSRATTFTGWFPPQHGVTGTLTPVGKTNDDQHDLPLDIQNMAKLLKSAGYDVQYRGKWHMSKGAGNTELTPDDLAAYGFDGWTPPDAGGDINVENFGGGCANNDQPYVDQAVAFLNSVDPNAPKPWALIVSLVNPHDLLSFPKSWDSQSETDPTCFNYRDDAPGCFNLGIELPPTRKENLITNYKPTAQAQTLAMVGAGLGILDPARNEPEKYVNFYGFLQKHVDAQIGAVLDALDGNPGLADKTMIFRIADHGELGLSHGGLRQKMFNCYEEMLNVPLIVSNPVLFPNPVETDALASLIDLMPTLATVAQVPNPGAWTFRGVDLMPVIQDASDHPANPTVTVQESVLFTFDDESVGTPGGQTTVKQPNHIRAVRTDRYKYAVYFDPYGVEDPQYELYDLQTDPTELHNMADPENTAYYDATKVGEMHTLLSERLIAVGLLPVTGRMFMPYAETGK
ncbi:MAG: sulfatase-like hydrolase/transferase [Anaerolineales bacterium]|nr:sulfatase-like hydrolase/transferase [Anaerolineales bacterium]